MPVHSIANNPKPMEASGPLRRILSGSGSVAALIQSLVTKFAVLGLNAGTGILVARLLQPEGRGQMAAMIMWAGFLTSALTLGVPSALIYSVRRATQKAPQLVGAAITIAFALGIVAGLLGLILVPTWLSGYSPEVISWARWFLVSCPIPILLIVGRAALEASGDFSGSNASYWLVPSLTLLALGGLMFAGLLSPVSAGLAYVLSGVPVAAWMLVRLYCLQKPSLTNLISNSRELMHYGVRSYGVDLVAALALQADQVLVAGFVTATSMGIYLAASNVARMLSVFPLSIVMVLFPRTAGLGIEEIRRVTGQAVRVCTALAICCGMATVIIGPSLMSLLYGPNYAPAASILRVLVLEALFSGNTQVLAQAFMSAGRPGVVTVVQTAGVTLSIGLMIILIPHYGVMGAALSMALSGALRLAATLCCFPLFLRVAPPSLLITMDDLRFIRRKMIHLKRRTSASGLLEGQAQHAG